MLHDSSVDRPWCQNETPKYISNQTNLTSESQFTNLRQYEKYALKYPKTHFVFSHRMISYGTSKKYDSNEKKFDGFLLTTPTLLA